MADQTPVVTDPIETDGVIIEFIDVADVPAEHRKDN